jgi:hypothetical protein
VNRMRTPATAKAHEESDEHDDHERDQIGDQ